MIKWTLPLLLLLCLQAQAATTLKVLQFNIWQEGTVVPGGFEAIADEIIHTGADIITFSEVRNYQQTRFCDRIREALVKQGRTFYSEYSYDSGILSAYPITRFETISPEKDDHGSVYKAVVRVKGTNIAVYTAHLDYLHAANYLPRGYHSSSWKKLPAPVTHVDSILADNRASQRDEEIELFMADARRETAKGSIVILGGDFNEPSHRDWTAATKDLFDHHGTIVPWNVTMALEKEGFTDAYRQLYPNPVTHPGFTFPGGNTAVPVSKLAWSPDADDRDRIDFVFFRPDKRLRLKDAAIVGPRASVVYGAIRDEQTKDKFIVPQGVWPTDHKALLVTFDLK
ncbi:Endonuclease/Exonuclease/phosphatase family protein [Chitinophaga eiseniae]|uniref:Endonuclease/Exonuclease/phosphatase family protein n=1 Tax=Chitinophaga eiseniae TaxID=634771 RepID=A0A1T4KBC4_9BACT|nr:endonuclease/exonuclease/phosphatase family protein [Chitinophaga eiseniae]SJZ39711.1 Endonuclease/Exonuclease/phosphatase family protein [Chitinophaga eiseniae]